MSIYKSGGIELINADSKEYLQYIPSQSIDLVLIDPPYELELHGGGSNEIVDSELHKNNIQFISNGFDYKFFFSEIERVCKVVNLICFCSNAQISKIMAYWENKGYSTTLLVWDKPNPAPLANKKYVSNLEFIVFVRGKRVAFNDDIVPFNDRKKSYTGIPSPSSHSRIHPTEKPLQLILKLLLLHSNENDTVLDFFAGSFSTAQACLISNRKCIAIEKENRFFEKGVLRIKSMQARII